MIFVSNLVWLWNRLNLYFIPHLNFNLTQSEGTNSTYRIAITCIQMHYLAELSQKYNQIPRNGMHTLLNVTREAGPLNSPISPLVQLSTMKLPRLITTQSCFRSEQSIRSRYILIPTLFVSSPSFLNSNPQQIHLQTLSRAASQVILK